MSSVSQVPTGKENAYMYQILEEGQKFNQTKNGNSRNVEITSALEV